VHFAKLAIEFAWPNQTRGFNITCETAGKCYLKKKKCLFSQRIRGYTLSL